MYELLIITLLTGEQAHVAPRHIVSIVSKVEGGHNKLYSDKVTCAITVVDGRVFTTAEPCDSIEKRLQEMQK